MKITFAGGVKEVTGSCFLLEEENDRVLVDCGLIQGDKYCEYENFEPFVFNPKTLTAVVVTHAHIDHIGRLPKLYRDGFTGYVYSTLPTKTVAVEMLADEMKILEDKHSTHAEPPLFNQADIKKLFDHWQTVEYHQLFNIGQLTVEFFDAGHILGSAFIKISFPHLSNLQESASSPREVSISPHLSSLQESASIVISGDLGNEPDFFLKPTELLPAVDYVVLESTYGDSLHEEVAVRRVLLENIIEQITRDKGVLLIPAFALERTQELLFDIADLMREQKVVTCSVFLDSPLALRLTEIYQRYQEYLGETARKHLVAEDLFNLSNFHRIYTSEQAKRIDETPPPKIIISGSGMLQGGRILSHLKRYLPQANTVLLFVGFQPKNSLGRKILDGAKEITIDGDRVTIAAQIRQLMGYSSHKDQAMLLNWLRPQRFQLKKVFLVHGETEAKAVLSRKIMDNLGIETYLPNQGEEIIL